MARNGDETGAGGESAGWLGHVCARLKAKVDEALDAVCDAPKVEGVAEAEKLARAVGVIARAAKAVGAMTGWLGERFPDCEVRADLDAVAALQPERDALWARLEGGSFLTDEERRRMAGVEA